MEYGRFEPGDVVEVLDRESMPFQESDDGCKYVDGLRWTSNMNCCMGKSAVVLDVITGYNCYGSAFERPEYCEYRLDIEGFREGYHFNDAMLASQIPVPEPDPGSWLSVINT